MRLLISIDGACRRNGKPDCVSSGGVFAQRCDEATGEIISTCTLSSYEVESTNQRGELNALHTALCFILANGFSTQIITDSEYIFNAMTKEWCVGWKSRGWRTASFDPVKNADLWERIDEAYKACVDADIDIVFYHIKGHCIPFGKVTANTLLARDSSGAELYNEVLEKYDAVSHTSRAAALAEANKLSLKNNGFELEPEILRHFVAMNVVADAIATRCVDAADSLMD